MRRILAAILLVMTIISVGCNNHDRAIPNNEINNFRSIPGITAEEIAVIEALKNEKGSFTYGYLNETESFRLPNGEFEGFVFDVCQLFSGLFEIEFVPEYYAEWESLKNEIDNKTLDFSGVFVMTDERMQQYHMTTPVTGRSLKLYTADNSLEITTEKDINGQKLGFLRHSVLPEFILEFYPNLTFETVDIPDFASAAGMLETGEIDAFVVESALEPEFEQIKQISSRDFFQQVYAPVSIATGNPELAPVISAINKYLEAGGINKLYELHNESERAYIKYKLHKSFTPEELAYLESLFARGGKVDIGIQHDVYPVSFYNANENRFEGIALDILEEISALTDIKFETITTSTNTPLSEILTRLKAGEISMMTQLLYMDSRKNDYIWSAVPYHTTRYALISKSELPDLEPFQVFYKSVGTLNRSAHEEMFNKWFPNHQHHIVYNSSSDCLDALQKGEVDLIMLAENMLLTLTNYREEPGYKNNISFNATLDSLFGYSKSEEELRSIVDKALYYINYSGISDKWLNRSFDYSKKISEVRMNYLYILTIGAFFVLGIVVFMFFKNKGLSKNLHERSAELSTIFTSIPDIVFCMDKNLVYTNCNPSFERFSGLSREKIIGKTDAEVFCGAGMANFFTEVNKAVIESKSPVVVQENVTYQDGSKRVLETIKVPFVEGDEITGLMGIARDITDHTLAEEEAREASRVKSQFLANMSHEIRTPMNAIIGMSELLLSEPLNLRQKGYVKDISLSSNALMEIINAILDLSKIEAGKMELNNVDYDLSVLLNNIKSMFEQAAHKKNLDFKLETRGDIPRCLNGDDARLKQVLTDICGNAVKFTHTGHIKLTVTAADETVSFEVRDTGIGIHKEDIPQLFDAFIQADMRKNRNVAGTGLGLAISKSFVEMMGGNIKAESVYGEGSAFTITIPKVLGDESKIVHLESSKKNKKFYAPDAKILIVDDNEVNLKVAGGLLQLFKINVVTVDSGRGAIEELKANSYDIVFMDHMMPEMDGVEATEEIRKMGGRFKEQTIVALTANAVRGAREMFLQNGFDEFLSKPIDINALTELLLEFLPEEKIIASEDKPNDSAASAEGIEQAPGGRSASESGFIGAIKTIGDINPEIGIEHFSGIEDLYRETLALFYRHLPKECEKMENFINEGDLPNFAILVHGMKSSLSIIGSLELSEEAFKLETASKGNDADYCAKHWPRFLEALRDLYERMTPIFGNKDNTPREQGETGYLIKCVEEAIAAANDFDIDAGIEAVSKALIFDYGEEINSILENAKDAFGEFDFDAAAEILENAKGAC